MRGGYMIREDALQILKKYVKSESLIKHCLAVEAGMIGYSKLMNGNTEEWSIAGLVHDIDFELYPEEHPFQGKRILQEEGFTSQVIHSVMGHADYTNTKRESSMDKALYAVDELASFIVACVLVRPSKSFDDLEVKSVIKKFKDKAFARAVDRESIRKAAEEFGIELNQHVENMIGFLKERESELRAGGYSLI
jgi:predicted hydrolase (HD superfamily)